MREKCVRNSPKNDQMSSKVTVPLERRGVEVVGPTTCDRSWWLTEPATVAAHTQHMHSTGTAQSQHNYSTVTVTVAAQSPSRSQSQSQSRSQNSHSQHMHSTCTAQVQHSHSTVTAQSQSRSQNSHSPPSRPIHGRKPGASQSTILLKVVGYRSAHSSAIHPPRECPCMGGSAITADCEHQSASDTHGYQSTSTHSNHPYQPPIATIDWIASTNRHPTRTGTRQSTSHSACGVV